MFMSEIPAPGGDRLLPESHGSSSRGQFTPESEPSASVGSGSDTAMVAGQTPQKCRAQCSKWGAILATQREAPEGYSLLKVKPTFFGAFPTFTSRRSWPSPSCQAPIVYLPGGSFGSWKAPSALLTAK